MNYILRIIILFALLKHGLGQAEVSLNAIADVTEGTNTFFVLSVLASEAVTSDTTATFSVDISASTAIPGYDFGGTGTYSCIILDTTTDCSVSVAIVNDTLVEPDETVTVDLTNAESLTINSAASKESFMILSDSGDTGKVQVNFQKSTYNVDEGGVSVSLDVDFTDDNGLPTIINGGSNIIVPVTFPRINTLDTAIGGDDYGNSPNPLVLPYDKSTLSISFDVTIVNDTEIEATEVVYISMGTFAADTYAELGTLRSETAILIKDDDVEDFICLSTTPETFRRSSAPFTFYAVSNQEAIVDAVTWNKRNLQSSKGTLTVMNDGSSNYAQKLTVNKLNKNTKNRYGDYTFHSGTRSCTVFIRAANNILNYPPSVAQKYTLTIYPSEIAGTTLLSSVTFGISYTSTKNRNNLIWKKDNSRIRNTAITLTVTDTSAAGIYEVSRRKRGNRGWFAIIQLIAADCPEGVYKDAQGDCQNSLTCGTCYNGGICHLTTGFCVCPPCFQGTHCELIEDTIGTFGQASRYSCTDFGLNAICKGALFSYEGNYGSTCGCGWSGTDCTEQCSTGTFGADCSLTCHCDDNTFCNFRTGVCGTGICETGYQGNNCQIPD